jgi:hypothetical protein
MTVFKKIISRPWIKLLLIIILLYIIATIALHYLKNYYFPPIQIKPGDIPSATVGEGIPLPILAFILIQFISVNIGICNIIAGIILEIRSLKEKNKISQNQSISK